MLASGGSVTLWDRDEAAAAKACAQLGAQAQWVAVDVGSHASVVAATAQTLSRSPAVDALVNSAGITGPNTKVWDYPVDAWAQVINTNLSGVFFGMKYQIPAMLEAGGGAIINISSILGSVAFAHAPAYTAAKHGVVGLTRAAALEYSALGLRINSVGPAFIHTPMISRFEADTQVREQLIAQHPIGRLGQPEEVAELVLWLASSRASFVTGAYYPVDGGYLAR
jgi:NAD(P)-dependent dehydrogenase (short-subunit alcohol dehydrogenase family)